MTNAGLYVHIPFCSSRCSYCDFATGLYQSELAERYVCAVVEEIRTSAYVGQRTDTIYFGGGTPSLLQSSQLDRILNALHKHFAIDEASEITIEINPGSVNAEKLREFHRLEINRTSFGAQTFDDTELAKLGRSHNAADALKTFADLRASGFANISFDLIAGLPHQTKDSWKQSLAQLISLEPEHVSVYLLEVDEGSRLGQALLTGSGQYSAGAVPSEDEMAEFYEMARAALGAAGYRHYEISNWAKPGFASKHNLKYWRREPYLGFGAGAHSFSGRQRWANAHDAAAYVRAIESGRLPLEQLETVTGEQALDEELFLGLRQLDGIDVGRIEREYGVTLGGRLEPLAAAGLLEREGDVVRLAEEKLSVSNEVFVELMK